MNRQGRILVVDDLPKWREIVCGLGCGLVVDPNDPEALAAAIEELLADPEMAEEMGKRGRAAVKEKFNWDREAPRLLSLYRALQTGEVLPEGQPAEPEMATVSS